MRTDDLYLVDILDAAREIRRFLAGTARERFATDDLTRSAVLWQFTVLLEAAGRLSAETRGAFPDVPWDNVRSLRNRLIHGYFTLEVPVLWDIVSTSVPDLERKTEAVLRERYPETYRRAKER